VALVAPSGPIHEADVDRAIANARSFGWEPVVGANVLQRYSYFAATDARRLDDLNAALRDDGVDGVWCIRGGYGMMRILDGVDYEALVRHPRPIMGYSDITALHAAVNHRARMVSYHAPVARATLTDFTRDSLERAVVRGVGSCGAAPAARTLRGGVARGRLAGGNLSLMSSLAGTPFLPDLDGAILVLEDVNEGLYRVDRMLMQLLLAGALGKLAGIAFGQCTGCDADESLDDARLSRTLDDVLREIAETLDVPCITGIPLGHIDDQWTIPLGASAELDADACTLTVRPTGDA
jgi:muramoyltetrapeptide carboxypeptidase